ncbi:deoxyribonuclease IV [Bacillus suaedae]|uniref:Deoxyribonuclease IV n=1 Tax=Halalkalibacter suaedae TaxID=2822140 RepID=A0A941ANK9_9BACI|nr:deoxyribonuclease IV [Bacillus suaedae]MBP3950457.1 deoxyribonuclease IV [Bacillus suaedae]
MFIGSHVSIANGYFGAAKTISKMGGNAFQYFPKNPRSLSIKEFNPLDTKQCRDFCIENDIVSVAHSSYPTNLIPENNVAQQQVIQSLLNDLEIAESCGSIGVVVHFGSSKQLEPLEGYTKMIAMINNVLTHWQGSARLLIENNAGVSSDMGITIEEMVQIRELSDYPHQIGFCFDTCHAFASGIWTGDNWLELETKGIELDFFSHLDLIHFNNSKYPVSSRKDRHANLSTGHIATTQLQTILRSKVCNQIPLILETPKNETASHPEEIALLKSWY